MVITIFNNIHVGTQKLYVYILLVHEHFNVLANKKPAQESSNNVRTGVSIEDSD